MPNVRAPGQKLLNFPAYEDFIKQIDEAVAKSGAGDRSKWIREAIVEKLESLGIRVPPHLASAPPRAGKNKYPSGSSGSYLMSDAEQKAFKKKRLEAMAAKKGIKPKKKKPF